MKLILASLIPISSLAVMLLPALSRADGCYDAAWEHMRIEAKALHESRFPQAAAVYVSGEKLPNEPETYEMTIEFEVREPGDHEFVCTFHTQLNQVGTMTVSG